MMTVVKNFQLGTCHHWVVGLAVALALTACSTRGGKAPIEDRSIGATAGGQQKSANAMRARAISTSDSAGKPTAYTVKAGDSLSQIAREAGVSWNDIARWNNLENPNQIEVGQSLRLQAPAAGEAVSAAPVVSKGSRPVASVVVDGGEAPPVVSKPVAMASSTAAVAVAPASSTASVGMGDEGIAWIWPARGAVVSQFDAQKNKGISIAGNAGDPVIAAADGVVVYAGAGLRGYGNLVILKHNAVFLTAYAHNQTLLVKEDQQVRKGQKIAEMGSSESDRVKLHFEVRRNSTPVDPAKYLPAR